MAIILDVKQIKVMIFLLKNNILLKINYNNVDLQNDKLWEDYQEIVK